MKIIGLLVILFSSSVYAQLTASFSNGTSFYKGKPVIKIDNLKQAFHNRIYQIGIEENRRDFLVSPIIGLKMDDVNSIPRFKFYNCLLHGKLKDHSIAKKEKSVEEDFEIFVKLGSCSPFKNEALNLDQLLNHEIKVKEGQKSTWEHFCDILTILSEENGFGDQRPWTVEKTLSFLNLMTPIMSGMLVDRMLMGPPKNPVSREVWSNIVRSLKNIRTAKLKGISSAKNVRFGLKRVGGFITYFVLEAYFTALRKAELSALKLQLNFVQSLLSVYDSYLVQTEEMLPSSQIDTFFLTTKDVYETNGLSFLLGPEHRVYSITGNTADQINTLYSAIKN